MQRTTVLTGTSGHRARRPIICLLVFHLAACGNEEDRGDAIARCNDLQTTICDKIMSCALEEQAVDRAQGRELFETCMAAMKDDTRCEDAVDVAPNYAQCIDDVESAPCGLVIERLSEGRPVPNSCRESIYVSE